MSSWLERLRENDEISHTGQGPTDKTDKTQSEATRRRPNETEALVLSALSVPSLGVCENPRFDEAGFEAMRCDLGIVVQDLLREGRKVGYIRRLFGVSFHEISSLKRRTIA